MLLLFRLLAVTGLLVLGTAPSMAQTPEIAPGHVGSQTCSSCHESEGQAWKGSHHACARNHQSIGPEIINALTITMELD